MAEKGEEACRAVTEERGQESMYVFALGEKEEKRKRERKKKGETGGTVLFYASNLYIYIYIYIIIISSSSSSFFSVLVGNLNFFFKKKIWSGARISLSGKDLK